jgi:phosphoribosylamine--glycine ligase
MTAGGRVLSVTAVADGLQEAAELSRSYAERISFSGKQMRRDIAWRELTRGARVT